MMTTSSFLIPHCWIIMWQKEREGPLEYRILGQRPLVMVNGVSGAIYRKFCNYEYAWDFVQKYLDSVSATWSTSTDSRKPTVGESENKEEETPVGHALGGHAKKLPVQLFSGPFGSSFSPRDTVQTVIVKSLLLLLELAGPDPSMQKEDDFVGTDMGLEIELIGMEFVPPGLTAEGKRDLANTTDDGGCGSITRLWRH
jgi:hypothetical protein